MEDLQKWAESLGKDPNLVILQVFFVLAVLMYNFAGF